MKLRSFGLLLLLTAACSNEVVGDDAGATSSGGPSSGASSGTSGTSGTTGSGGGSGCEDACDDGAGKCQDGAAQTCETGPDGCRAWSAPTACGDGKYCDAGACLACTGVPGSYSDQTIDVDGETRHFYLHVPPSYACNVASPLLIDFHGTAVAPEGTTVEEFYALDAMIAVADKEGFIVARPRSRPAAFDDTSSFYQWDSNPGDLDKNAAFGRALVEHLRGQYHVDPARLYASGFSNGTNMAAQFLADDPPLFTGYGIVAGGMWAFGGEPDLSGQNAPRVYATTGFRDYMLRYQRSLEGYVGKLGLDPSRLRIRETDAGHELYGWHYSELFAWLDRGEAPALGSPDRQWTADATGTESAILQLARGQGGVILAGTAGGSVLKRDPQTAAWTPVGTIGGSGGATRVTDLCVLPSGQGVAVGDGAVALTSDFGATWQPGAQVPEFFDIGFGYSYLNTVACSANRFLGGGYWAAVVSDTFGQSWSPGSMDNFGYPAQVAAIATSPDSGATVAVGYWNYVGHSADGVTFEHADTPVQREWFTDVAAASGGRFWIVGEAGTILASADGGTTWAEQSSGTDEDLYAVDFSDPNFGVAVGAHGTVLMTTNGGQIWTPMTTGIDGFLGDVIALDGGTILAAGEKGTAIWTSLFFPQGGAQ